MLWRNGARPRRQDVTQIVRQSFVHPEQFAFHRGRVVRRRQASRASILAVPRMGKLMRQKTAANHLVIVGAQTTLGQTVSEDSWCSSPPPPMAPRRASRK